MSALRTSLALTALASSLAPGAAPAAEPAPKPTYVAVVVLEFLPAWLALPRAERREVAAALGAVVERHPDVAVRFLDADALGRGYTDLVLCEYSDFEKYHFLWEELRDSVLFTVPYVRMHDVLIGMEEGFQRYEATLGEEG